MTPSRITLRFSMHLNFGRRGSSKSYRIEVDGKPTTITRTRCTGKKGALECDVLRCGDEQLDLLAVESFAVAEAWILERA